MSDWDWDTDLHLIVRAMWCQNNQFKQFSGRENYRERPIKSEQQLRKLEKMGC